MTFILAMGNPDYTIQMSDMRLTRGRSVVKENASKLGVLMCSNARMGFSYAGLAQAGRFITRDWMVKTLSESDMADLRIESVLEDFRIKVTNELRTSQSLRNLPAVTKRLSFVFSGFYYQSAFSCKQFWCVVTNYQDFDNRKDLNVARDEFKLTVYLHNEQSQHPDKTFLQRFGNWPPMTTAHWRELKSLLRKNKPPSAVLGKAENIIREISASASAENTIGKNILSVTIPADRSKNFSGLFHNEKPGNKIYTPDCIYLTSEGAFASMDLTIEKISNLETPFVVNKVRRNNPCPCGSRKKYKYCHGKR